MSLNGWNIVFQILSGQVYTEHFLIKKSNIHEVFHKKTTQARGF